MSSTVWFEGLNDEARDQQFGSTTARGKITGSACAARGLKRNKDEGSNSGSGDQLMRTSSSFKWKITFFFFFFLLREVSSMCQLPKEFFVTGGRSENVV